MLTTSIGSNSQRGSLSKYWCTPLRTAGIRVAPPARNTASISPAESEEERRTWSQMAKVRLTRSRLSSSRVSRVSTTLLPAMGAGSRTKGRNLGVLRGNSIKYKLLVEMRNLAFDEHIWAIRYEQRRQRDAEKVVEALLSVLGEKSVNTQAASQKPAADIAVE